MASDESVLARCRAGDARAFDEIVHAHRERLLRYLTTMAGDSAEAEDLVQEVFRRAWKGLSGFDGRARLGTWLYRIAVNVARSRVRRRAHEPRPQEGVELEASAVGRPAGRSPLSSVIRHESADLIALAIDRLPPSLRESFLLHYVEGLPYEEIGEITGVAVGTLHVRAQRARTLLRKRLGPVVDTVWVERR